MDRTLATRCDYVKTTPDQRGPLGRWLTRVREERYRTQPQALAAYRRLAWLVISESEYAQWESGSRVPRPDNPKLLRLFEFYGSRPEDPEPEREQAQDMASLVSRFLDEIAALREERQDLVARVEDLEQSVAWLRTELARVEGLAAGQAPVPPALIEGSGQ